MLVAEKVLINDKSIEVNEEQPENISLMFIKSSVLKLDKNAIEIIERLHSKDISHITQTSKSVSYSHYYNYFSLFY